MNLLHGVLGRRLAGCQFRADEVEGRVLGGQAVGGRAAVAGDLRFVEHGLRDLHQVGAGDDLGAGDAFDQLLRARRPPRLT
jgi:hypothetical protein